MDYLAIEKALSSDLRRIDIPAGADCGHKAIKVAIGRVVYNPLAILFLECVVHLAVERRSLGKAIEVPELLDLAENLLTIGVIVLPGYRVVELVKLGVDLKCRRVVNSGPDSSHALFAACFKDVAFESSIEDVTCGCDACDTRANDGDSGPDAIGSKVVLLAEVDERPEGELADEDTVFERVHVDNGLRGPDQHWEVDKDGESGGKGTTE